MNIDEIKRNAPDGATHYDIDDGEVFYWKISGNGFLFWNDWFKKWYSEDHSNLTLQPLD